MTELDEDELWRAERGGGGEDKDYRKDDCTEGKELRVIRERTMDITVLTN